MQFLPFIRLLSTVSVVLLVFVSSAAAQSGRGMITGHLADESGGAVPLCDVSATHRDTGVVTSSQSNDSGVFRLVNLPPGAYTVHVRRQGFRPFVQTDIAVGVESTVSLDVTLRVGELADSLTVVGESTGSNAHSATAGTTLRNSVVTNLPLSITSGRSIENFAYAIVPGAEGNNWASNIAGGTPFSKEVVLDGTSATIQIQGHISESSPPMDAVEEFKVQTSGMSAEYGRTGGGIFNFSLRSGTNVVHGSLHGQLRNEALNANSWSNKELAAINPSQADAYRKPRDRQHVFGGSAGGPIAAGKTFYFASFEEYRQTRKELGQLDRTVPTAAFLDGDFSALLDTSALLGHDTQGQPIYRGAIFDPATRLVFPGNVIPRDRISRVSAQIADIYRNAYQPLVPRLTGNSAGPAYVDPEFSQHQLSLKADHNFANNNRISGSIIWTSRPRTLVDQGGVWDQNDATGGALSKARRHEVTTYQGRVSHSQVLSSSMMHAGTLTVSTFRNPSTSGSGEGNWPQQLGLNVAGAYGSFPQINFGDPINGVDETDIGYGISNYYLAKVFQYNDNVSWSKGRHLFKFGGELRFTAMDSYGDRPYLEYHFSPVQTGMQGGPSSNQVGFGFASFLLGEVERASQHVPADFSGSRNYAALFAQDDFRISNRLTLNLGRGWESTSGWRERQGRWSNFNTGAVNPVTGVQGTLEFADQVDGSFEGPRDLRQFAPRIGVTYEAGPKLVLRSGYGLYYAPVGTNFWAGVPYSFAPGFFGVNAVAPPPDGAAAFNWDRNPYTGTFAPATRDPAYTQWGMVSVNPRSLQSGRMQNWNAGLEYQLGYDVMIGAAYIGNRSTRLASGDLERNQPSAAAMKQLLTAGTEWNWVSDESSAAAAHVPYPYPGFSGTAWMAITPYPQAAAGWGPLFFVGSPLGRSDYHAAQFTVSKQASRGVSTLLGYTLSRQRGNVESSFQERWTSGPIQDVSQLDREAGVVAPGDRTHVLKGYVAWALPFGRGRRFLSSSSTIVEALAAGWTISTIVRYESGVPLAVRSNNSYAGWQYPIYANRVADVPLDGRFDGDGFDISNPAGAANQYFNPRAFANPAYAELGAGPGRFAELRGFGGAYEDIGIIKDVRMSRYSLQLRVEILNVFNRRYFADPETNLGSANFGQVTALGSQPPRQGQLGVRFMW